MPAQDTDDLHFDFLVIGDGQTGLRLAKAFAETGRRVAIAERKHLGGSCINFGCTPTKAVLTSARLAHMARRGKEYGIAIPEVAPDFAAVLARAREIVHADRASMDHDMAHRENPLLLRGHARLTGRSERGFGVTVTGQDATQTLTADNIVLNTGTRALIPPLPGLDSVPYLTSGNWLYQNQLPARLVIIGGSYIALEMSQFYRRMGSDVTVIEQGGQLLSREDEDVAGEIQRVLEREGVKFLLNTHVQQVARGADGTGLALQLRTTQETETLDATDLFVATGRQPNTDDLGLETVGVALDEHGIVTVDNTLATSVEGIWAAGDIRGGPQFTHTSWDDHRILKSQILGDRMRTLERIVPYGVFTDPQLGRVGMTEKEARASGQPLQVARMNMTDSSKAVEIGETDGFIKVVVNPETKRLLGASVLCAEGAEIVHAYIDLLNADAPYTTIVDAIHIHPTLSEAVQTVFDYLK